jgi:hypothetical protein
MPVTRDDITTTVVAVVVIIIYICMLEVDSSLLKRSGDSPTLSLPTFLSWEPESVMPYISNTSSTV